MAGTSSQRSADPEPTGRQEVQRTGSKKIPGFRWPIEADRRCWIAALLGMGAACLLILGLVLQKRSLSRAERPKASGDVGMLVPFAQGAIGPFALKPLLEYALVLPQDLAFEWFAEGSGPRIVRIELEFGGRRRILHEERLTTPARGTPLAFVLSLDQTSAERASLSVTVEAPHARSVTCVYGLHLLKKP